MTAEELREKVARAIEDRDREMADFDCEQLADAALAVMADPANRAAVLLLLGEIDE